VTRAREWAARAALVAASVAGCLLVAEAGLRAAGWSPRPPARIFRITNGTGADLQYPGRAGRTVLDCYDTNPRGSFPVDLRDPATLARYRSAGLLRLDEAAAHHPFGIEFRYNRGGFRERERGERTPAALRVAFIGDSFLEGQGVAERQTSVRLVEATLGWEAWNLGVRGRDFPEMSDSFAAALQLRPDVIVYAMVLNDADRDKALAETWPKVNDWIMVRQPQVALRPIDMRVAALVRERYEVREVTRQTLAWYRALYSAENRGGWARTREALAAMKRQAEARGIGFGVALWPLMVGLEGGYPFEQAHASIRQACERRGIPFADLLDSLRGRRSSDLWVHESDLHPNEHAHALVAPSLVALVRRLQSAPAHGVARPDGRR
jgi:hypothetical protein